MMIKTLFGFVIAAYVVMGVLLVIVRPQLDTMDGLAETRTGRSCQPNISATILLWPFYINYYYGGGFDTCSKDLYK
jgi:hypothetical protein